MRRWDIIKQSEVVLNQVLGLSVTSDLFSGYSEMNAYERFKPDAQYKRHAVEHPDCQ